MSPRRDERSNDSRSDSGEHLFPILATETTRNAAASSQPPAPPKSGDEKMSIFWRVFGGTAVSIVALVIITAYQMQNSSINDLRNELAKSNEARADLVKKEDFATSRSKIWDKLQEMQKDSVTVQQLKDRMAQMEEQNKTLVAERKADQDLHATFKQQVAALEQQLKDSNASQKELQTLQQTVAALQEKATLRDQQLKQMDDEKKELVKELQAFRERLAKVEAAKDARPPVKTTSNAKLPKVEDPDDPDMK
jgi:chromosome segregation ATPase